MKFIYTLFLFFIALGFVACNNTSGDKKEHQNTAIPVTVCLATQENNTAFFSAGGKVKAVNSATLSTRIMGFADKIYVHIGQKVTKGQALMRIHNADLSAKQAQTNAGIAEAQAAFANAGKDYERYQNLYAENSASQKELDDQRARYEIAKARLERANQMKNEVQSQFAYVNLKAPFTGVIANKFIEAGDMANPGMPLILVEGSGNFEVITSVSENEISKIKQGMEVKVKIKSLSQVLSGKVSEVSTSAKNTGGQYVIKATLNRNNATVFSGMYATVQFPTDAKTTTKSVLVSKKALIKQGQLTGIYTVSQHNTALLRWLRLGHTFGDEVEVLSGLKAGEKYIVSAEGRLFNGTKITLKE